MPVKIRLTRMGKKKQPSYRVVVVDSRKPRDGAYLEQIGRYDPRAEPSLVEINNERALDWLQKGAQPTERAQKLLEISGAWTRFRIDKGDIHTIGDAPQPEPKQPEPVAATVDAEPASEPVAVETAVAKVAETPVAPAEEEATPQASADVDIEKEAE